MYITISEKVFTAFTAKYKQTRFMSNKQPFRDFDLPTKHLGGERHYIPPKARASEEIERRKSMPRGTVLAEQQQRGIAVATAILSQLDEGGEGLRFATKWLAASGINTAWYNFAAEAPVMRRRLKLPILATDDPEQRPSALMLHRQIVSTMHEARGKAAQITSEVGRSPLIETHKAQLGRSLGHASLTMSCFAIGDFIGYESATLNDFDLQALARQRGLASLEDARVLSDAIGVAPSEAQLADPDSPLSVFWRREAPQDAFEAYEFAIAIRP